METARWLAPRREPSTCSVMGGKVYNIANQSDADLQTHAGHTVTVPGEMEGDTITVSKIVMPAAKKS